jgi:hypothetical protein
MSLTRPRRRAAGLMPARSESRRPGDDDHGDPSRLR